MNRDTELRLIERLLSQLESGFPAMGPEETWLDPASYTSPERAQQERDILFRRMPIIVGHASQLAARGDVLCHDALGVPLLLVRTQDGDVRGFLNVCRHRGSRLVTEESRTGAKALVCGYHGWTYRLDGQLLHIPHEYGFNRTDCDRNLVPIAAAELGGFLWAIPAARSTMQVGAWLGPLASEIESLDLGRHTLFRSATVRRRCNWKLMIDAFLDGYHIRQLHRNSVYRFFLDNMHIADSFGPHIRSIVARKELEKARQMPKTEWRYRELLSLTYMIFPNTVLVFHPDWVSRITMFPAGAEEMLFAHDMLIPPGADTDAAQPHWEKTWHLIQEVLFEKEDLLAAEWIQSGFAAGANNSLALGRYEAPIRAFHDSIEKFLAAPVM